MAIMSFISAILMVFGQLPANIFVLIFSAPNERIYSENFRATFLIVRDDNAS